MKEQYFCVCADEDGDWGVTQITEQKLIKEFDEGIYKHTTIVDKLPYSWGYGGDALMIIKGKIITPVPKKVIDTYSLQEKP